MFEGEFKNGQIYKGIQFKDDNRKNGILKAYSDGKLIFEGEYSNGEKNGKGKRYNYQGEIIFEGEFLNGKKWNGKGKEYIKNKQLLYEYVDGKRKKFY